MIADVSVIRLTQTPMEPWEGGSVGLELLGRAHDGPEICCIELLSGEQEGREGGT